MDISERFWTSGLMDAKNGYMDEDGHLICLLCGYTIETGVIYPVDDRLYEAGKYMEHHIASEHGSVFEWLNGLDKRITGLSAHQASLMALFYEGKNDHEVQQELGIGSISTIRAHRFALKEKEKQARVFLVMMDLLRENSRNAAQAKAPERVPSVLDGRYGMTEKQYQEVLDKYLPDGPEGELWTFMMKEKYRIIVMTEIMKRFEAGRVYKEREMNAILKRIYPADHVQLRRFMIDYGFMTRKKDGSGYWIRETAEPASLFETEAEYGSKGRNEMSDKERRKELVAQYKEKAPEAGIYRIINTETGKYYLAGSSDIPGVMNRFAFAKKTDSYSSLPMKMAKDVKTYGLDKFSVEVLEMLKVKPGMTIQEIRKELKLLEEMWREEHGDGNEY